MLPTHNDGTWKGASLHAFPNRLPSLHPAHFFAGIYAVDSSCTGQLLSAQEQVFVGTALRTIPAWSGRSGASLLLSLHTLLQPSRLTPDYRHKEEQNNENYNHTQTCTNCTTSGILVNANNWPYTVLDKLLHLWWPNTESSPLLSSDLIVRIYRCTK